MSHAFDAHYWETHWQGARGQGAGGHGPQAHPYLSPETADLAPGTALDAGCGRGAEAIWLATQGWQVTAVDISPTALAYAAAHAEAPGVADRVDWVAADLGTWEPGRLYDLVTSSYAHPSGPQLDFYQRLGSWVAPGGTLLLVGHRHHAHGHEPDGPPPEAMSHLDDVTRLFEGAEWKVVTAAEHERTAGEHTLHDVVVRARRR